MLWAWVAYSEKSKVLALRDYRLTPFSNGHMLIHALAVVISLV